MNVEHKMDIKPSSQTRWKNHVNSLRGIKIQASNIREVLFQLAEQDNDPKIRTEAESLTIHEIENFELLLAMVTWYELLTVVNGISKSLQTKDMCIDVAIKLLNGLIKYLEKYKECEFENTIVSGKKNCKRNGDWMCIC